MNDIEYRKLIIKNIIVEKIMLQFGYTESYEYRTQKELWQRFIKDLLDEELDNFVLYETGESE